MTYIVVFDDEQGLCTPMTWDRSCPGAIEGVGRNDPVAAFHDRADARRAIKVSQHRAEMNEALGRAANDDFLLPARKCIRIMRLEFPLRLPWDDAPWDEAVEAP